MADKSGNNLPKRLMQEMVPAAWLLDSYSSTRVYRKPGEYILSRSPMTRAILRDLKSDDIADVRWPPYDNTDSSNR